MLGLRQVHPAVPVHRPDKVALLQPFAEQAQAARIGPEDFHPIAAPACEDKRWPLAGRRKACSALSPEAREHLVCDGRIDVQVLCNLPVGQSVVKP